VIGEAMSERAFLFAKSDDGTSFPGRRAGRKPMITE
jgi:hypothetical protein